MYLTRIYGLDGCKPHEMSAVGYGLTDPRGVRARRCCAAWRIEARAAADAGVAERETARQVMRRRRIPSTCLWCTLYGIRTVQIVRREKKGAGRGSPPAPQEREVQALRAAQRARAPPPAATPAGLSGESPRPSLAAEVARLRLEMEAVARRRAEFPVDAVKCIGTLDVPAGEDNIKPFTIYRLQVSHARRSPCCAPLRISFVIIRTKQAGGA